MTSASDEKWRPFNFFSVLGKGGSPTEPDTEIRVGDRETWSPGRPVSSGLQVPGEPGHCRARTKPPWWLSRGVFLSKCRSFAPAETSNALRWYFGPLEDNEWGGRRLDPKNRGDNFSSGFLHSEFLGAGWAAMPTFHWLLLYLRVIVI